MARSASHGSDFATKLVNLRAIIDRVGEYREVVNEKLRVTTVGSDMPSTWQLNLFWNCGRLAVVSGMGIYLFRHSWLNGSDDLGRWMRDAQDSLVIAVNEHLLEPLAGIHTALHSHLMISFVPLSLIHTAAPRFSVSVSVSVS
jgi:hypothetical protein